jgi:hypothetical protein
MKKTGTIEALNVSPKGFHEGFLFRTGKKLVQINLPKGKLRGLGKDLTSGEQIAVEIELEEPHGEPEYTVYRLVRLLGVNGGLANGGDKHGIRHFSGSIARLNYALHGEVNGGVLDSGEFLHLKPEGARAVKLKAGMQVEGKGVTKPMVGDCAVIEAEEVNGIAIRHNKAKKLVAKHAGH